MWETHYKPFVLSWGRHYIRRKVIGTQSYPKFTKLVYKKVLYHGLLQSGKCFFCLYSWARGGCLPFDPWSTSLSVWFLRERYRVAIKPGRCGSWQINKEQNLSPSDSAGPGPLREPVFPNIVCTDQLRLSTTSSLSWPSSCQKQHNSCALKLKWAFLGFIS